MDQHRRQNALEDSLSVGLRDFLSWLPEDDVIAILKTTTGGLIFSENKNDAISTIVRYSDAISVLNRKRIKKDVLVSYLHQRHVSFKLPADKTTLCRICLTQWGHNNVQSYRFFDNGANKEGDENRGIGDSHSKRSNELNRNITESKLETSLSAHTSTSRSYSPTQTPSNSPNPQVEDDGQSITPLRPSHEENMEVDYNFCQEMRKQDLRTGQELAMEFTKWFYDRWNKLDDFCVRHFWPECNLRMEIISNSSLPAECKEILFNGQQCCEEMKNLIVNEGLFFNPNIQHGVGVRGKINPHGLAQVMVCGSVHQKSAVLGIFEQVFGLMKDPTAENNYKLKFTVLRFKTGASITANTLPSLQNSTLVEIIEEEDDE